MNTLMSTTAREAPRWQAVLHRWPSALGLVIAAVQLALDPDTETIATVIWPATACGT